MNETLRIQQAHRSIRDYQADSEGMPWSEALASRFPSVYFPQVKPVAAMQGLLNDK